MIETWKAWVMLAFGVLIGAALIYVWPWPLIFKATEKDWVDALSALATLAAVVVALGIGLVPVMVERSKARSEALLASARFVMVCKAPVASLSSISKVLDPGPVDPREILDVHLIAVLKEAHGRAKMPTLTPPELRLLSTLLGKRQTIAFATALATVESMEERIEAIELSLKFGRNRAQAINGLENIVRDAKGACAVLVGVRQTLESILSRALT
ncbi:hypothetical protein PCO31111_04881 [Pandoraea communis]|uniref:Uncharacterized protein n=1 Tax=Pandoraea communis TaxID=2508297 RepID=A0A5E4YWQ3_9BURK|nr:hypothetical protein [Pandoraea communis]VVE53319.1 hypothetical protein PCO31111_04881 [Pandoraea communis]